VSTGVSVGASGSVGISDGVVEMVAALEAAVEVSSTLEYGTSMSVTETFEWGIPGNKLVRCHWGTECTKTTGNMNYWFRGKLKSTSTESFYWTIEPFAWSEVLDDDYHGESF